MIIRMHEDTETWVVYILTGKVQTFLLKIIHLNKFCSNCLVSKVSENSKKSVQFELISRQNNNNRDLTKELDKDESCLTKLRVKHPKNIIFGYLDINSLQNKFEYLKEIIKNTFYVFLVSQCKLDLSQYPIPNS